LKYFSKDILLFPKTNWSFPSGKFCPPDVVPSAMMKRLLKWGFFNNLKNELHDS